jgi:hypothetical protein
MDTQILVGAAATLTGSMVTQIFSMVSAARQASREDRREKDKWDREQASKKALAAESLELERQAKEDQKELELKARYEEFLHLVLESQVRLVDRIAAAMNDRSAPLQAAEIASAFARKAYALALLYLNVELRSLARNYYVAAADLDVVMERREMDKLDDAIASWQRAFSSIDEYYFRGDMWCA